MNRILRWLRPCTPSPPPTSRAEEGEQARVSALWGQMAAEMREECPALPGVWTSHPVVRGAMNRRLTGRPEMEWTAWVKEQFFPDGVGRVLSLGCGAGHLEREAMRLGLGREIEGVDVSEGAIEVARARAEAAGLHGLSYRVADLNHLELPVGHYDLVVIKQALHHLDRLEHVLDQVRRCLRPDGWFVLNEFVGPTRFQWTEAQLEAINRLLLMLPTSLRQVGEQVRERVACVPPEQIAAHDPSEAVRSSEIMPLLAERFEVIARRDFGGTILNPLLEGIIANFEPADEMASALLRLLCEVEDLLLDTGAIPSDFVLLVTRPLGDRSPVRAPG